MPKQLNMHDTSKNGEEFSKKRIKTKVSSKETHKQRKNCLTKLCRLQRCLCCREGVKLIVLSLTAVIVTVSAWWLSYVVDDIAITSSPC